MVRRIGTFLTVFILLCVFWREVSGLACPSADWTLEENNCYIRKTSNGNHAAATSACAGFGAYLATIANSAENTRISSITPAGVSSSLKFWIGLEKNTTTNAWNWVDGSNTTHNYLNWQLSPVAEPDGTGNCAVFSAGAYWKDENCLANANGYICEKVGECTAVPTFTHATHNSSDRNIGNTVGYECDQGFAFEDGSLFATSTCLESGAWSPDLNDCEAKNCSVPPSVDHASITPGYTIHYTSLIEYTCDPGYIFLDINAESRYIECNSTAQWNMTPPACELKNCPAVPNVWLAVANSSATTVFTEVFYECVLGFEFSDNETVHSIFCNTSAEWNTTLGDCRIKDCVSPPIVQHASSWSNPFTTYGSVIRYTCDLGYEFPSGLQTEFTQCDGNKQWTPALSTCIKSGCDTPPVVTNATMNYTGLEQGDTVNYTCAEKYTFPDGNTSKVSECMGNRLWSPAVPDCLNTYVPCQPIINPLYVTAEFNGTEAFDYALIYCDTGYRFPTGEKYRNLQCQNGEWNNTIERCNPLNCGIPPEHPNITRTYNDTTYGASARYDCVFNGTFFPDGGITRLIWCSDNGWSAKVPACKGEVVTLKIVKDKEPAAEAPPAVVAATASLPIAMLVSIVGTVIALDVATIGKHIGTMKENLAHFMHRINGTEPPKKKKVKKKEAALVCKYCKQEGHKKQDCPICRYCKSEEHISKDCYLLKKYCDICGYHGHLPHECDDSDAERIKEDEDESEDEDTKKRRKSFDSGIVRDWKEWEGLAETADMDFKCHVPETDRSDYVYRRALSCPPRLKKISHQELGVMTYVVDTSFVPIPAPKPPPYRPIVTPTELAEPIENIYAQELAEERPFTPEETAMPTPEIVVPTPVYRGVFTPTLAESPPPNYLVYPEDVLVQHNTRSLAVWGDTPIPLDVAEVQLHNLPPDPPPYSPPRSITKLSLKGPYMEPTETPPPDYQDPRLDNLLFSPQDDALPTSYFEEVIQRPIRTPSPPKLKENDNESLSDIDPDLKDTDVVEEELMRLEEPEIKQSKQASVVSLANVEVVEQAKVEEIKPLGKAATKSAPAAKWSMFSPTTSPVPAPTQKALPKTNEIGHLFRERSVFTSFGMVDTTQNIPTAIVEESGTEEIPIVSTKEENSIRSESAKSKTSKLLTSTDKSIDAAPIVATEQKPKTESTSSVHTDEELVEEELKHMEESIHEMDSLIDEEYQHMIGVKNALNRPKSLTSQKVQAQRAKQIFSPSVSPVPAPFVGPHKDPVDMQHWDELIQDRALFTPLHLDYSAQKIMPVTPVITEAEVFLPDGQQDINSSAEKKTEEEVDENSDNLTKPETDSPIQTVDENSDNLTKSETDSPIQTENTPEQTLGQSATSIQGEQGQSSVSMKSQMGEPDVANNTNEKHNTIRPRSSISLKVKAQREAQIFTPSVSPVPAPKAKTNGAGEIWNEYLDDRNLMTPFDMDFEVFPPKPETPFPDSTPCTSPKPMTPHPEEPPSSTPKPGTPNPDQTPAATPSPGTPNPDQTPAVTPVPQTPAPETTPNQSLASIRNALTPTRDVLMNAKRTEQMQETIRQKIYDRQCMTPSLDLVPAPPKRQSDMWKGLIQDRAGMFTPMCFLDENQRALPSPPPKPATPRPEGTPTETPTPETPDPEITPVSTPSLKHYPGMAKKVITIEEREEDEVEKIMKAQQQRAMMFTPFDYVDPSQVKYNKMPMWDRGRPLFSPTEMARESQHNIIIPDDNRAFTPTIDQPDPILLARTPLPSSEAPGIERCFTSFGNYDSNLDIRNYQYKRYNTPEPELTPPPTPHPWEDMEPFELDRIITPAESYDTTENVTGRGMFTPFYELDPKQYVDPNKTPTPGPLPDIPLRPFSADYEIKTKIIPRAMSPSDSVERAESPVSEASLPIFDDSDKEVYPWEFDDEVPVFTPTGAEAKVGEQRIQNAYTLPENNRGLMFTPMDELDSRQVVPPPDPATKIKEIERRPISATETPPLALHDIQANISNDPRPSMFTPLFDVDPSQFFKPGQRLTPEPEKPYNALKQFNRAAMSPTQSPESNKTNKTTQERSLFTPVDFEPQGRMETPPEWPWMDQERSIFTPMAMPDATQIIKNRGMLDWNLEKPQMKPPDGYLAVVTPDLIIPAEDVKPATPEVYMPSYTPPPERPRAMFTPPASPEPTQTNMSKLKANAWLNKMKKDQPAATLSVATAVSQAKRKDWLQKMNKPKEEEKIEYKRPVSAGLQSPAISVLPPTPGGSPVPTKKKDRHIKDRNSLTPPLTPPSTPPPMLLGVDEDGKKEKKKKKKKSLKDLVAAAAAATDEEGGEGEGEKKKKKKKKKSKFLELVEEAVEQADEENGGERKKKKKKKHKTEDAPTDDKIDQSTDLGVEISEKKERKKKEKKEKKAEEAPPTLEIPKVDVTNAEQPVEETYEKKEKKKKKDKKLDELTAAEKTLAAESTQLPTPEEPTLQLAAPPLQTKEEQPGQQSESSTKRKDSSVVQIESAPVPLEEEVVDKKEKKKKKQKEKETELSEVIVQQPQAQSDVVIDIPDNEQLPLPTDQTVDTGNQFAAVMAAVTKIKEKKKKKKKKKKDGEDGENPEDGEQEEGERKKKKKKKKHREEQDAEGDAIPNDEAEGEETEKKKKKKKKHSVSAEAEGIPTSTENKSPENVDVVTHHNNFLSSQSDLKMIETSKRMHRKDSAIDIQSLSGSLADMRVAVEGGVEPEQPTIMEEEEPVEGTPEKKKKKKKKSKEKELDIESVKSDELHESTAQNVEIVNEERVKTKKKKKKDKEKEKEENGDVIVEEGGDEEKKKKKKKKKQKDPETDEVLEV